MKKPAEINLNVQLFIYKDPESDMYVAYCNSLDLSTYGKDHKDALQSFGDALDLFIDETTKKGTLEHVLVRLGWNLSQKAYGPPAPSLEKLSHIIPLQPTIEEKSVALQMI